MYPGASRRVKRRIPGYPPPARGPLLRTLLPRGSTPELYREPGVPGCNPAVRHGPGTPARTRPYCEHCFPGEARRSFIANLVYPGATQGVERRIPGYPPPARGSLLRTLLPRGSTPELYCEPGVPGCNPAVRHGPGTPARTRPYCEHCFPGEARRSFIANLVYPGATQGVERRIPGYPPPACRPLLRTLLPRGSTPELYCEPGVPGCNPAVRHGPGTLARAGGRPGIHPGVRAVGCAGPSPKSARSCQRHREPFCCEPFIANIASPGKHGRSFIANLVYPGATQGVERRIPGYPPPARGSLLRTLLPRGSTPELYREPGVPGCNPADRHGPGTPARAGGRPGIHPGVRAIVGAGPAPNFTRDPGMAPRRNPRNAATGRALAGLHPRRRLHPDSRPSGRPSPPPPTSPGLQASGPAFTPAADFTRTPPRAGGTPTSTSPGPRAGGPIPGATTAPGNAAAAPRRPPPPATPFSHAQHPAPQSPPPTPRAPGRAPPHAPACPRRSQKSLNLLRHNILSALTPADRVAPNPSEPV